MCICTLLAIPEKRYTQIKMKLILLIFFIIYPTSNKYLLIAEGQANENIDEELTKNDKYFVEKLESFFENYLNSNQIANSNDKDGFRYYKYLKSILNNGASFNNVGDNIQANRIKDELEIIGLNNEIGIRNLFYESVNPVVQKYQEELSKEKYEDELLLKISEHEPSKYDNFNIPLLVNGLLSKNEPNDFKRPFLKKFVIIFIFIQLELNK